jgi:hypothetical protein
MANCDICCEPFSESATNKSKRVPCNYCAISVCRACVQRFMVESNKDPCCMGCGTEWTRGFLDGNLQKAFMATDFRKYWERALMDKEVSMLADAQYHANHVNLQEALDKRIVEGVNEVRKSKRLLSEARLEKRYLAAAYNEYNNPNSPKKTNIPILHRQCPIEECNGCVGLGWRCGLCSAKICSYCHEVIHLNNELEPTPHICIQENIDTARALMNGTKPCPCCATLIFKIDGCSQMFCVSCHTAFDWRTGSKVNGKIHNPHYYEHLRTITQGDIPRDPDDQQNVQRDPDDEQNVQRDPAQHQCIVEPTPQLISLHARSGAARGLNGLLDKSKMFTDKSFKSSPKQSKYEKVIHACFQLMYHLSEVSLPDLRANTEIHQRNLDLRVKFLLGRITKEKWQVTLFAREKKIMKTAEILGVCEIFHETLRERIIRLISQNDVNKMMVLLNQIVALKDYANEEFRKIAKKYKNLAPHITSSYRYGTHIQDKNGPISY